MHAARKEVATPEVAENVVELERSKERFVFRDAEKTADVLPFDFVVGPGGGMALAHLHLHQHEIFRCVSGALTVHLKDGPRILEPGQSVDLPPGTVHSFSNDGAVDAVCHVEYRPAGRNEDWLKIMSALERKLGRQPGMLDIAPFILDVGMYVDGPPPWMQRALFSVLRVVAIALGRKKAALEAAAEVYGRPFTWD